MKNLFERAIDPSPPLSARSDRLDNTPDTRTPRELTVARTAALTRSPQHSPRSRQHIVSFTSIPTLQAF